jgi:tyrosyl-tRNA synthetase
MKFPPLNEQLDLIRRGTHEIVSEEELARKIARAIEAGRPLVVKQGFDPTRPDIHIGHTISIRKLKDFQDLGHEVVFLIGTFTALIGDPSGRSETRPLLSPDEVEKNARTYMEQVFKILDPDRTQVRRNREWLAKLSFEDVIRLAAKVTVARMLERDDFAKRYREGRGIAIHELLYPLAQGYDSVALESDVELGGTDQTFNLLMARDIQREYGIEPQVVITVPLLEGTDGVQKMSKTANNAIGITEPPAEIYGKTMSVPDELIVRWLELATRVPREEVEATRRALEQGSLNPRDAKRRLARELVAMYHGPEAAAEAEAEFDRLFVQHELPEELPLKVVDPAGLSSFEPADGGSVLLAQALQAAGLVPSYSEGLRMLRQGAVSLDGERAGPERERISCARPWKVKVGKRRFAEIRFERR